MLETVVIALFAVALALLLLAGALALLKLQFLAQAARADGTVVSLRPDGGAGSSGSSQLLCPIVRFMTKRGEEVEFAGGPASSPPRYRIGDVVPVRYRPSDPAATARIPMTPTPADFAALMMARGSPGSSYCFMLPTASIRLATACTAAGRVECISAWRITMGTPVPVMAQAPIRPDARSFSMAGMTRSR